MSGTPGVLSVGVPICVGLAVMMSIASGAETPVAAPTASGEFLKDIPYNTYIHFEQDAPAGPVFDVRDYGAVGDGKTLNSEAIAKAVEAAHEKGSGTVRIEGGDFVSGTIQLKSNVTLHIARGSILRASRELAHYGPAHFIYCEKAKNIRIEGPGKILGDGDAWWRSPRVQPPLTPPDVFSLEETVAIHHAAKRSAVSKRPSPLIRLRESADLVVSNVIIENSPGWTLSVDHCDQVRIEGVVINNNYHGANTDGIDIVGSSNVDITKCFVSTGDDGIVLKNGFAGEASRAMANIRVSNCTVRSSANCFKIGTETWSDISDVQVSECTFFVDEIWPWALSGIAIESVDGARVRHVSVQDITMRNVMTPVFIRLGNRNRWGSKDKTGAIEHIAIKNVSAVNAESPCIVSGIPGLPVKDVTLDNIAIKYREAKEALAIKDSVPEAESEYPECFMFGDLPAYSLFARHVDGLAVRNFRVVPRSMNQRKLFAYEDVANLNADQLSR